MDISIFYIEQIWEEQTIAGTCLNPPFPGLVDRLTLFVDRPLKPEVSQSTVVYLYIPCMGNPIDGVDPRDLKKGDCIALDTNTMMIHEVRRSFSCLRKATAG